MKLSPILTDIFELVFPNRCRACGLWGKDSICDICMDRLEGLRIDACCKRCGKPYVREISDCPECRHKRLAYERILPVFKYEGYLRDLIHSGKYHNDREVLKQMARMTLENIGDLAIKGEAALCPVPITRRKKRQRGYNQAEIIAKELSRNLDLPVFRGLRKVKHTADQNTLDRKERLRNLKGAFISDRAPRAVILIDDVMTTGATLNECSKELKKNGCRSITGLVLARA